MRLTTPDVTLIVSPPMGNLRAARVHQGIACGRLQRQRSDEEGGRSPDDCHGVLQLRQLAELDRVDLGVPEALVLNRQQGCKHPQAVRQRPQHLCSLVCRKWHSRTQDVAFWVACRQSEMEGTPMSHSGPWAKTFAMNLASEPRRRTFTCSNRDAHSRLWMDALVHRVTGLAAVGPAHLSMVGYRVSVRKDPPPRDDESTGGAAVLPLSLPWQGKVGVRVHTEDLHGSRQT